MSAKVDLVECLVRELPPGCEVTTVQVGPHTLRVTVVTRPLTEIELQELTSKFNTSPLVGSFLGRVVNAQGQVDVYLRT